MTIVAARSIPKLWVGQLSLIGISEVRLLVPELRFAWSLCSFYRMNLVNVNDSMSRLELRETFL